MKFVGIDPGPEHGAWVEMMDGKVVTACDVPSSEIAQKIACCGSDTTVACEHMQCFGMSVGAETFETAYWIGEYRAACRSAGVPFVRVMRGQVKMHLCSSMRAKDANIRQAILDLYGGAAAIGKKKTPGPLYGISKHMWSALAVLLTAQAQGCAGEIVNSKHFPQPDACEAKD